MPGGHGLPRQRPPRGSLHHLVDVGVGHAVQVLAPAAASKPAYQGVQNEQRVDRAAMCQQHRWNGGDEQQLYHARLRQRHVGKECGAGSALRDALANAHAVDSSVFRGSAQLLLQTMVDAFRCFEQCRVGSGERPANLANAVCNAAVFRTRVLGGPACRPEG